MRHLFLVALVGLCGCYSAHERPGGPELWECSANTIVRRYCAMTDAEAAAAYCEQGRCVDDVACFISEWSDVWSCEGETITAPDGTTGSSD